MGISSKKTKITDNTTSNTVQHATQSATQNATGTTAGTTQRTNPEWVTNAVQGVTGQIGAALGGDPTRFVAPASGNQQGAFTAAANLGAGSGDFASARSATGDVIGARARDVDAESLLTGLGDYFNPYDQNVRQSALGEFDVDASRAAAAAKAAGARNSAFGGSRFGVAEGVAEGERARDRGALDAGLLHTGFTTAADLSDRDANRRMTAQLSNQASDNTGLARDLSGAGMFANIGQLAGADERANVGTQLTAGGVEQQLMQAMAGAPISTLSALSPLLKSGLDMFGGVETTGTTNTSGTSSGVSDGTTQLTAEQIRRIKEDPSLWEQFGNAIEMGSKLAGMF